MGERLEARPRWQEATFDPAPASVAEARRFVRQVLPVDERTEVVVLLVSELATNAVCHASTAFEVRLLVADPLKVEVRDQLPLPPLRALPAADSTTGRGLQILDALALRWGVELWHQGKAIWFEL